MATQKKTIGIFILQIAMAIFLIVSGILTVQLDKTFGFIQSAITNNEVANAVYALDLGKISNVVIIILGVCEIIAGAFLVLNLFINTGALTPILLLIIMIVWGIIIVLVDIMGNNGLLHGAFSTTGNCLSFFKSLSGHLMVFGALLTLSSSNN